MRLWHQALIPYLDIKRLLGQHRECCALRGKGWGKKHSVVDYVFKYDLAHLYQYHLLVMHEINNRTKKPFGNIDWYNRLYRGKHLPQASLAETGELPKPLANEMVYREHDDKYLRECLLNLKSKGAELVNGMTIDMMLINLDLK